MAGGSSLGCNRVCGRLGVLAGAGWGATCAGVAGTITVVVPVGASKVAAKYTKYNSVNTAMAAITQMPAFDIKSLQ